jgi:hypothetical protein
VLPIVLVSRKTLESFLDNDPEAYWNEFYRRYPGSNGHFSFSSIGYSADGNVAVLMVQHGCGSLCYTLSNVAVNLERGQWHVAAIEIIVIA